MSGWLTDGVPTLSIVTGLEQFSIDTQIAEGAQPQTASLQMVQAASALKWLAKEQDKTTVSGSRYYVGVSLGNGSLITGIDVLVGSTGGTDSWIVELHDSTGALVATSNTAGVTAGTAGVFQRLPFTAAYEAAAGNYFVAVQSNGNTAKLATYGSTGLPLVTGSATGSFGTGAAITPPTTYTANLGPIVHLYV